MTIFVDANIVFNVWREESNPKTGTDLAAASAEIFEYIVSGNIIGKLSSSTCMEIMHSVRVDAELTGKSVRSALVEAEKDISKLGCEFFIPDMNTMALAYELLMELGVDPFDAILLAAAKLDRADAVVSRDRKLIKRAKSVVPALTPEEILKRLSH